ncbi:MAG TPA: SDR family oxidoreductase [Acetobacteraceae bacterium]|nr:SDR family oxidoreductase [Acetobacteraceae bacterium]
MLDFAGKVAVITGAGSGFGREFARIAADLGMKLALADIQADALSAVMDDMRGKGVAVIGSKIDVSRAEDMDRFAAETFEAFGAAHLLFNNAGVASGGLIWENTVADWQWVMGVNVWGVIHGVRCFVPHMLAQGDECHVVNTASVAGLLSAQMMGVYNVSKHAVVTLSETLFQDLRVVGASIGVTVLCPAFVNTGIKDSGRNRPADMTSDAPLTESQKIAQAQSTKAVTSGRMTAREVADMTFECIRENKFYCLTHKKILGSVELRLADIMAERNPSDPFSYKKDVAFTAN